MCRNCILVLFLPLVWIYTLTFKPNYLLVLLTKTDETNEASGIVSISLNHGNFSAGLYIKQGSSRGSLQRFSSSSLNRSIILFFPAGTRNLAIILFKIACTISLPIHFLRVSSCTEKRNVEKSSITVSVNDGFFYNNLPDSLRWDKVNDIVSHSLNVFVEFWFLVQ